MRRIIDEVWINHAQDEDCLKSLDFEYHLTRERALEESKELGGKHITARYIPGPENVEHWEVVAKDLAERVAGVEEWVQGDNGLTGSVVNYDGVTVLVTTIEYPDGLWMHASLVREVKEGGA